MDPPWNLSGEVRQPSSCLRSGSSASSSRPVALRPALTGGLPLASEGLASYLTPLSARPLSGHESNWTSVLGATPQGGGIGDATGDSRPCKAPAMPGRRLLL